MGPLRVRNLLRNRLVCATVLGTFLLLGSSPAVVAGPLHHERHEATSGVATLWSYNERYYDEAYRDPLHGTADRSSVCFSMRNDGDSTIYWWDSQGWYIEDEHGERVGEPGFAWAALTPIEPGKSLSGCWDGLYTWDHDRADEPVDAGRYHVVSGYYEDLRSSTFTYVRLPFEFIDGAQPLEEYAYTDGEVDPGFTPQEVLDWIDELLWPILYP